MGQICIECEQFIFKFQESSAVFTAPPFLGACDTDGKLSIPQPVLSYPLSPPLLRSQPAHPGQCPSWAQLGLADIYLCKTQDCFVIWHSLQLIPFSSRVPMLVQLSDDCPWGEVLITGMISPQFRYSSNGLHFTEPLCSLFAPKHGAQTAKFQLAQ
jgi:hypothetical protein